MPAKAAALAQIDAALERCGTSSGEYPGVDSFEGQPESWVVQASTTLLALLDRIAAPDYKRSARSRIEAGYGLDNPYLVVHLIGVVQALRGDVEAGFTQTLAELVHADVFGDMLEMADELHQKGYKDPAAVIVGSVLEEHLRKLALKSGVPVEREPGKPKKADTINADLAKIPTYNKLVQKQITAWLDLRNKAAHGEYTEYDADQVAALIRDVRGFLVNHPA